MHPRPSPMRSSVRFLALLLLLALWAALLPQATLRAAPPTLAQRLNAALDSSFAAQPQTAMLAAVTLPGQEPWIGARGLADRERGLALALDARFRIASVGKLFVATVALQLVQEGWLLLDHSVEHWLPGQVPNGSQISVRQLLNHTSGLYDYLDGPFMREVLRQPQRIWSPAELVAYGVSQPARFAPGAPGRWSYSNTNYVLLGLIIERVTKHSLAAEIQQRIITPLNLQNTFFEPVEALPANLLHAYEGRRDLTAVNLSFAWAAGNMSSSVADLTRFAQALFDGRLLRAETLALMQGFVGTGGPWGRPAMVYGLGMIQDRLSLSPAPDGQARPASQSTVRGHIGSLLGYQTALWYQPETGAVIVVVLNVEPLSTYPLASRLLDAVVLSRDGG